jgi:hypothetical protein
MMRIMEQQPIPTNLVAVFSNSPHQVMVVPFMHNDQVSTIKRCIEVECL